MRLTEEQLEKIKNSYDIVTMAEKVTKLHETEHGALIGKCPFCNDKEENLGVSRNQQIFHCFNCRRAGNVFDFYGNINGFRSLNTIANLMAEEAGINLVE